jgi:hypothetical protein
MPQIPRAGALLDTAQQVVTGPGTAVNLLASGQNWPLLANRIFRIYNVSALLQEGDLAFLNQVISLVLILQFFSSIPPTGPGGVTCGPPIVLAANNWNASGTVYGVSGVGVSAAGDPLFAFKSNAIIAGNTAGPPVAFAVSAAADLATTDPSAVTTLTMAMLFDDIAA